jgi:hypothetical protein
MESSTWHLAGGTGAPRRARAWVRETLPTIVTVKHDLAPSVLADAALCVSELVTASLLAQSTTMTLRLLRDQQAVRLSLFDDCVTADQPESVAHAQQLGFRMIDAIVDRWGIDTSDGGRELWVALRIA